MAIGEKRVLSPLHEQTRERILEDLARSRPKPGAKLQPLREMARTYGVSYLTVQRAVNTLQQAGVLEVRQGDGTYFLGGLQWPLLIQRLRSGTQDQTRGAASCLMRTPRTTRTIAIVLPPWVHEQYAGHYGHTAIQRIINGLMAQSDPHHWKMELVYTAPPDEADGPEFVDKIMSREADGVAWLRPLPGHRMNLMRLADRGLEVVVTGRRFPRLPVTTVSEDYGDIASKIMDRVAAAGKSRIALFTGVTSGAWADPFAADILAAMRSAARARGLEIPDDLVCQITGNPMAEEITRAFLARRREVEVFVSSFGATARYVRDLALEGFWPDPASRIFYDLVYEFRPFYGHNLGGIPLIGVLNPTEDIGRGMAQAFEERWLGKALGPKPDLSVRLVGPEDPE